ERRPGSPEFRSSRVPPMRTCDWLARPASHIAASFDDPDRAVEWLAERYEEMRRSMPRPDGAGKELRLANAADALPRGVDVQWGEWLAGGRFASVGVICCPNKHADHPCPVRRP